MGGNFVNIVIIQICKLTLLSVCVRGAEIYFEVVADPVLVEQLAVSSAQMQSQAGTESPTEDIIETEIIVENIFNRNTNEIVRLCADAIPIDTYGFQFELDQYQGPKTAKRSFQVERIEPPTNDLLQLETLNCPRITYLDLETNRKFAFFDIYFLSQATDRHSVIILKRSHVDGIIYPQRCITKIDFHTLTRLAGNVSDTVTRFIPDPIIEIDKGPLVGNVITTYQTLKQTADVYTKFMKLYASLTVCNFPREHKVYTCRQALETRSSSIKLDIEQYFEEPCHRRLVHFTSENDSSKSAELYLSRCPPALNISISKPVRQTTFFYIASNASQRSVVVFSHVNMKGEKTEPLKVVRNLDILAMKQDKERVRLSSSLPLRPSGDFLSPRSAYLNLKKSMNLGINTKYVTVRTPAVLATKNRERRAKMERKQSPTRLVHSISGVEEALIEFSRIKKNVFVYRKFMETYTSIDFCNLNVVQKKSLCDEALSDAEYGLTPHKYFISAVSPCYRQKIALTSVEAERLQTETFSMWTCPPSETDPRQVYHMGKSNLRDAAFLYRDMYLGTKSDKINAIHPVTLFLNINRYALAKIV